MGLGLVLYTSEQKIIFIRADSSIGLFYSECFSLSMLGKILSRQHFEVLFLFFPEKETLAFHANCLNRRQFAGNVKTYFLGKIKI